MRHMMMMAMHGHGGGGMMVFGMVRRVAMKLLIVGLVVVVGVLWFRLRQARNQGWR
jgi:hypothetical protein